MAQTEVATTTPIFSDEQFGDLTSFDDALNLLSRAGVKVAPVSELGDGFDVVDKDEFIKTPFIILEEKIIPADKSDHGTDFVVLRIMTETGRKAIITDGSTGICRQVVSHNLRGISLVGRHCEKGLEVSNYDYVDAEGKRKPARTFYIAGM